MTGLSDRVTQLLAQAEEVNQAVHTYGETLSQAFDDLTQPGTMHAPLSMMQGLNGLLQRQTQHLKEVDQRVLVESFESKKAVKERNHAFEKSRKGLVNLKANLKATYGSEILDQLALTGKTPKEARLLERQLKASIEAFEKNPVLPEPLDPETPHWTEENLKNRLKALHQSLEDVVTQVQREARETQGAQIERREAISEVQKTLNMLNGFLIQLADFVGKTEIAERIRPSVKRGPKPSSRGEENEGTVLPEDEDMGSH